ncbi:MAG: PHP domain-containing protein [Candidatus Omnitrophota bacterium]
MKFADLHLHTIFSDGTHTPGELIKEAMAAGISCIAISDHDTIDGVCSLTAGGMKEGIEVLPALELSCEHEGREVHILGYLVDCEKHKLREKLNYLKENRIKRVYSITDKLKALGIPLDPEKVFQLAKYGTVGRLHIARAMVSEGFVNSTFEAFQKYLGDDCPAFVLGFKFSVQEAIKLIKESGGIPVLAHPYTMDNDELILKFIKYGLMGLEVYYPEHNSLKRELYLGLAEKYNLLVTGGSDYHGSAKPLVKVGSVKIPYELVENLKNAKEGIN